MDDTLPSFAPTVDDLTDAHVSQWLLAKRASLKGVPSAAIHVFTSGRFSGTKHTVRFLVSSESQGSLCESGDTIEEAYQAALLKVMTPQVEAAKLRAQADEILAKAAALESPTHVAPPIGLDTNEPV